MTEHQRVHERLCGMPQTHHGAMTRTLTSPLCRIRIPSGVSTIRPKLLSTPRTTPSSISFPRVARTDCPVSVRRRRYSSRVGGCGDCVRVQHGQKLAGDLPAEHSHVQRRAARGVSVQQTSGRCPQAGRKFRRCQIDAPACRKVGLPARA